MLLLNCELYNDLQEEKFYDVFSEFPQGVYNKKLTYCLVTHSPKQLAD